MNLEELDAWILDAETRLVARESELSQRTHMLQRRATHAVQSQRAAVTAIGGVLGLAAFAWVLRRVLPGRRSRRREVPAQAMAGAVVREAWWLSLIPLLASVLPELLRQFRPGSDRSGSLLGLLSPLAERYISKRSPRHGR